MYYDIHSFKVYDSMIFIIFIELCNNHHNHFLSCIENEKYVLALFSPMDQLLS